MPGRATFIRSNQLYSLQIEYPSIPRPATTGTIGEGTISSRSQDFVAPFNSPDFSAFDADGSAHGLEETGQQMPQHHTRDDAKADPQGQIAFEGRHRQAASVFSSMVADCGQSADACLVASTVDGTALRSTLRKPSPSKKGAAPVVSR